MDEDSIQADIPQEDVGSIKAPKPPVMPELELITVEVTEDGEEYVVS